jgi:hypothetical protein
MTSRGLPQKPGYDVPGPEIFAKALVHESFVE